MKATEEELKTGELVESNEYRKIYLWNFVTEAGLKAEIKYVENANIPPGWCAYLFLTKEQRCKINFVEDCGFNSDIELRFVNGEITFAEIQSDKSFKIGWDYQHSYDGCQNLDSIQCDVEACAKEIIRLCERKFMEKQNENTNKQY